MRIIYLLASSLFALVFTVTANKTKDVIFEIKKETSYDQIVELIIEDDNDFCVGYNETCESDDQCCKGTDMECDVENNKCICSPGYYLNINSRCYYRMTNWDITASVLLTLLLLFFSVASVLVIKHVIRNYGHKCHRNEDVIESDGVQGVNMTVMETEFQQEPSPDLAPRNRPALQFIIAPDLPPSYEDLPPPQAQPSPPPKYGDVISSDVIFDIR